MQSRVARLILSALAFIAIGGTAFFLVQTEQHLVTRRSAVRLFDQHARESVDSLSEIRAGQQAYIAAGQGVAFWMPKVTATTDTAVATLGHLRGLAVSPSAKGALDDALASLTEFGNVDKRVRDYIKSGQPLMAGDVVFTEGAQTSALAAHQVESARLAECQALDAEETDRRQQEATALGGTAALALIVIALLGPTVKAAEALEAATEHEAATAPGGSLSLRHAPDTKEISAVESARPVSPILRAAAELCTEFGRVMNADELTRLLSRAAGMIDATGIVVWIGDSDGGDLKPALAHGYEPEALARMPAVPRTSNNAAAAAYRTGTLQIVLSRPGTSNGAVVAPLLSASGCIGALSAEIQGGGEGSESVQALATIFAAQLVAILGADAPEAGKHTAASSQ